MGLPLALAIGSTAVSFMGSMNAARAAKREAALQRRQLQNQIEGAQLAAIQDHNARMRNLQIFQATNESLVGVSGRDMGSDRSFKAIQEKAKRETRTETDRKFLQTLEQVGQLSLSQSIATEKGRNLSRAYKYQAFGTLFSGAMKAQPLMPSTPATTTTPTFYGNTFDRAF
tara:strand:+ start:90 stop:602 length:513 start_codon:yes stop_codon:yes gene_type:complete